MTPAGYRGADLRVPLPRRKMDHRDQILRGSCTSITVWCGACWRKPVCQKLAAPIIDQIRILPIIDRSVFAVHPADAGDVPLALTARPGCMGDGARTRLSRPSRSLPPDIDLLSPVAPQGRSLSASALPCPASKAKSTGPTSDTLRLAARGVRLWRSLWCSATLRQIFLRFLFRTPEWESFLRGHVAAFNAWGGVHCVLLSLRQSEECGARTTWRRDPLPSDVPALLAGDYRLRAASQ